MFSKWVVQNFYFLRSIEKIPVLANTAQNKKSGSDLTAMGKRDSPAQNPAAESSASYLCLANLGTNYISGG